MEEKRPNPVYDDEVRIRFSFPSGQLYPQEFIGYVFSASRGHVTISLHLEALKLLQQSAGQTVNCVTHMVAMEAASKATRAGPAAAFHASCIASQFMFKTLCEGPNGIVLRWDKRWLQPCLAHVRFCYQDEGFHRMRDALHAFAAHPVLPTLTGFAVTTTLCRDSDGGVGGDGAGPRVGNADGAKGDTGNSEAAIVESDHALNQEQRRAVAEMLVQPDRGRLRPPLIIFGPPGTGKTKTVVAGMVEGFLSATSKATRVVGAGLRVLCCAPSDSASDVLAYRLHLLARSNLADGTPWAVSEDDKGKKLFNTKWMLRLNGYRRARETVSPVDLLAYCSQDEHVDCFKLPPLQDLLNYSAIVCTCMSAGLLADAGVAQGHFDLIVIDEAAQALEPEALIPLALAGPKTRVTLAGDWNQLGPVVRSRAADALGLSVPLIQRLARRAAAAAVAAATSRNGSKQTSPATVVELICNYRSHEGLLEVPSGLFYGGRLLAASDPSETSALLQAPSLLAAAEGERLKSDEKLPQAPLLFYGVQGREMRDGDSPSFSNPAEALVVCSLVIRLLRLQLKDGVKVTTNDIGIIAPYRRQVRHIRTLLRHEHLDSIRVGTVDDYQGQEERVIFISMTLTNQDRLSEDKEHSLGFFSHPNRFNVALTRAKSLLVLVGNPYLAMAASLWRHLLRHCVDCGAYAGPCPCPLQPSGIEGGDGDRAADGDLFEALVEERMLGMSSGGWEMDMESHFRDELEFRVLL